MRRLNARDFRDPNNAATHTPQNLPTASAERPVPLGTLARPRAPSAGVAIAQKIVLAQPRDLKYVASLQAKFSNHLGFLPTKALAWYIENRRVGIGYENGDPAGYVLGRTHMRYQPLLRPITQAAVQMDAQRRHLGMALVERVIIHAQEAGQLAVQASCAEDLESNEFWRALDFSVVAVLDPQNHRGRRIVVWRRCTTEDQPDWFLTPPPIAGQRARRTGA